MRLRTAFVEPASPCLLFKKLYLTLHPIEPATASVLVFRHNLQLSGHGKSGGPSEHSPSVANATRTASVIAVRRDVYICAWSMRHMATYTAGACALVLKGSTESGRLPPRGALHTVETYEAHRKSFWSTVTPVPYRQSCCTYNPCRSNAYARSPRGSTYSCGTDRDILVLFVYYVYDPNSRCGCLGA